LLERSLAAIPLEDPWAARTLFVGVAQGARLSPEAANLFNYLASVEPQTP
jgi:hypothetical protein